jgi:hypothetical protein
MSIEGHFETKSSTMPSCGIFVLVVPTLLDPAAVLLLLGSDADESAVERAKRGPGGLLRRLPLDLEGGLAVDRPSSTYRYVRNGDSFG